MSSSKAKVIVAMSGGVDSSVSALLLKQQGYEVAGLFMKNWEEDDTDQYCSATEDVKDAQAVCDKLGIPLHTVNFAAEYWDNVFAYFLQEYQAGRTPNPDVLCNREIKFKVCLDYAKHLGADYFATGHYARYENGQLLKGLDTNKDQTYFLHLVNKAQLDLTFFPIGALPKSEVRHMAEKAGLITHNKKDSTGICFIGERKFKAFLAEYLPAQPGTIETIDGKIIGKHDGLMYYTIGQRQGLHIGGYKTGNGKPWYAAAKDLKRNVLIVVQGHDHPKLFQTTLECENIHWINDAPTFPFNCRAKTRYRQADQDCIITPINDHHYQVTFSQPQWAITPGQSVVFYQENICLGGAVILL